MRSRRLLSLAVLASVIVLAHPAKAAPPDAAVTEAARARVAEGLKLYGKKRYDKAQAAFLQAYALTRSPPVLLVLGLTALKLNRPLEALHYFERFSKDATQPTPEQLARVEQGSAEARTQLSGLSIVAPDGAEITVDGEVVGHAPLPALDVLPGRHVVTSGGKTETVDVKPQHTAKVRLGSRTVAPPPNAVVEPDARPSAAATSSPPVESETTTGMFAPPSTIAPVYVAGAVGLASLTVAIVLGGMSANADRNLSTANDALARNGKNASACSAATIDPTIVSVCSTIRSAQHTSDDVKTPLVASLVAGAGATAFALAWYFFAPKDSPPRLEPTVSPQGIGLGLHTRF